MFYRKDVLSSRENLGKIHLSTRQNGCSPQKWNCDSVWNKSGTAIVFRTRSVKHKRSLRATWSINSACTRTKRKHNSQPMMSTLDQKTIDSQPAERSISQVSSDLPLCPRPSEASRPSSYRST